LLIEPQICCFKFLAFWLNKQWPTAGQLLQKEIYTQESYLEEEKKYLVNCFYNIQLFWLKIFCSQLTTKIPDFV